MQKSFPMTHTDLAAAKQLTPLAAQILHARKQLETVAYRGTLSPRELDASETEIVALATGAAIHDLGWMRRVAVRGEDRFRWLSGMVTNTVNDLAPATGAWNLVLNAQGRIQGDLTVWRDEDELELAIAADQYDRLLAHFEHFIIMDDVELVPLLDQTAVGLTGPQADQMLHRLGLPTLGEPMTNVRVEWNGLDLRLMRGYGVLGLHYEFWVPLAGLAKLWKFLCTAGAVPVGIASLNAFRIAEGIPEYGIDMVERDLPQETSQMRALSFNKGCYLGQEIVERIRSRGSVHRHLRSLSIDGPLPRSGTELTSAGGAAAGHITSAVELRLPAGKRICALGVIRGEAELRNLPLDYVVDGIAGTARLLDGAVTLE
jgi:folate-binding protein YgfZ